MAGRDIFSKYLPNVKLATRYDAEGREVQVERREDMDATIKEQETFDLLVNAGYYRAKIKGLSSFDKAVGGMTWCIECCDYDVDVDLLFHESLTIGQKIALVERIVAVLPQMKCPFRIEPHQIQGLEFLSIHPVIQWLVRRSVENRSERAQRLKRFAVGQFHNHYQYQTDREHLARIRHASKHIKCIQELYAPRRQLKRCEGGNEGEKTRVRMTLLEYGKRTRPKDRSEATITSDKASNTDEWIRMEPEIEIERLFVNLSVSTEDNAVEVKGPLDAEKLSALHRHYQEFKEEMETDAKQLSKQSQVKILEATKAALERKLQNNNNQNEEQQRNLDRQQNRLREVEEQLRTLTAEIADYSSSESHVDPLLLAQVQGLLRKHDQLKTEEVEFKEYCRQDLADLQKEIDDLERLNAENPEQQEAAIVEERTRIKSLKLQLAKKSRGVASMERQLDAIPDRTELTQYQRRFHELYNEMSAKHLETKQHYALYNTLNDKKRYMEKELSLLNSICEAYKEGMMSAHGREDFISQFDGIVAGVKQTEDKIRRKYNEERMRRDSLNEELQGLVELQRQYAASVKQLTRECQRCEQLQQHLKSIRQK